MNYARQIINGIANNWFHAAEIIRKPITLTPDIRRLRALSVCAHMYGVMVIVE